MTDAPLAPAFDRRRALIAGLAALGTHVLALLVGYLSAKFSSSSEGLRDLGHLVLGLLLAELILGLGCLITGGVLFVRGKRDIGFGLQLGWLVGLVLVMFFIKFA